MSDVNATRVPIPPASGRYLLTLSLGALGVVYGDIGTSPLYALRECFHGPHALPPTPANVRGVLSLVFWALVVIISIKYLIFVMRADNRGEGGILSLLSLIRPGDPAKKSVVRRHSRTALVSMGLFGAALLYGDGIITPAISVLSAVEGLDEAAPGLARFVLPITVAILIALFLIQKKGTHGVGRVFGPVTLVWFIVIGALGVPQIVRHPAILLSVNPMHALAFLVQRGGHGFLALGSVFLVVTGGEALYADMGHFGRRPIRLVWFVIALPALLLNYFGQGALLLAKPDAADHPFYGLCPPWALYPLIALATAATCIASQAVISGAFSLTRQAVQLGYLPRLTIRHTSATQIGQIYIPAVNRVLMFATIGLVLAFKSSSNLAAAYGVAVTTTMVVTTLLLTVVARRLWGWSRARALAMAAGFLAVDLAFFGANIIKVEQGGWLPLVIGASVYLVMATWRTGRRLLSERSKEDALPVQVFLADLATRAPMRVPGTAVFMSRDPEATPQALLHNFKHNKILHEKTVFLSILTEEVPFLSSVERVTIEPLGHGIFRVLVRYGFQEDPDIPRVLAKIDLPGLSFARSNTSFFLAKETVLATSHPGMALWREKLFALMLRNATNATAFFKIPPDRVVELGAQVEI